MSEKESQQPQEMKGNQEKLIYSAPEVIIIGTMQDVKSGPPGPGEHLCSGAS